jgi:FkbM family methyltransferase
VSAPREEQSLFRKVLFSAGKTAAGMPRWAVRTVRAALEDQWNYIILTPQGLYRQFVFAKRSRRFHSYVIRSDIDYSVLRQVFEEEQYRLDEGRGPEIVDLYQRYVAEGITPLVVDCGANIGLSTDYFAQHFPAARIVAIEPDHGNIVLARRNCTNDKVELLEAGIASRDGRGAVSDPGIGEWGFRTRRDDEGTLALVSVNNVLARYPDAAPLLIKIDIEGFEDELFSKNTGWIDRFPLLIIELHDWMLPRTANSGNFLKTIAAMDRDFTYRGENIFSFANSVLDKPAASLHHEALGA